MSTRSTGFKGRASFGQRWKDETSSLGPLRAIFEVLVVALCAGIACFPMLPAYGSPAALNAVVIGVLGGILPVLLGAFLRWPLPVILVLTFAVYVVVGGAVAFGDSLIAGFVPSRYSISESLTGIVTSWKEALTLEPPLGQSDGVLLFPFLVSFLAAFVVSGVTVWRRSWFSSILAMGVVGIALVVAVLWGTQETVYGSFLAIGLFIVLTVWASWRMAIWRPQRPFRMIGFLVAVVVASVALTPLVESDNPRFVLRSIVVPPFDPRDQVSPLSQYRMFVKDYAETPLITVDGLPEGSTVRLATLDAYDGVVWSVSGDQSRAGSGAFRRIGERIEQVSDGSPFDVTITLQGLSGVWTPTVGYLHEVDFESGSLSDFRFNDATGAGVTIGGVDPGTSYRLKGVLPNSPTDEELGEAGVGQISIADVSNVPDVVTQEAISISRDAANVPLVVRKFEEHLSTQGFFSHGEDAGGYPSLSGHGAARMADLFAADLMVGDAEQYASALALLARTQGIPARVVMGFAPEEFSDSITFNGSDMTAWAEVYFNDYGWVSYFPTPPESQTPHASDNESVPEPEPDVVQAPPDPQAEATPPALNSEDTNIDSDSEDRPLDINWGAVFSVVAVVGIPLILLLGIPAFIISRKALRRKRRKALEPQASVVGGWQEVVDHAMDLGIKPQKDFTRRETALYIEAGNPHARLQRIAAKADAAHFSQDELDPKQAEAFWALIVQACADIDQSMKWHQKFRSRLSVASFREQKRRDALERIEEGADLTAESVGQASLKSSLKSSLRSSLKSKLNPRSKSGDAQSLAGNAEADEAAFAPHD